MMCDKECGAFYCEAELDRSCLYVKLGERCDDDCPYYYSCYSCLERATCEDCEVIDNE